MKYMPLEAVAGNSDGGRAKMKIDLLATDGSQLKVIPEDIETGVGGAELSMLTFMPILAKAGHQVRVYNNPRIRGVHDGVEFLNINEYAPREKRDAVILYRSPNPMLAASKGRKVFWSCDQQTAGDYRTDVFPYVDHTVVISKRHHDYFSERYGLPSAKMTAIDLGVRLWDYNPGETPAKVPGRMIFTSVPDRGLEILRVCWDEIKSNAPHASLVITADYRLWGVPDPGNHQHKVSWQGLPDVSFLGMIPRSQLVVEQMQAQVLSYPCIYDEFFCITAAEAQVAGAVPITSSMGALETTNRYGIQIPGNPRNVEWQQQFIRSVANMLNVQSKAAEWSEVCRRGGIQDFDWNTIAVAWEGVLCPK